MLSNLKKRLLGGLVSLFVPKTSEFWTGTVNAIVQAVLRILPEDLGGQIAKPLADLLLYLFPYALGRVISKVAKDQP